MGGEERGRTGPGFRQVGGVRGERAGGGLAAAVTLLARDRGGPPLRFQFLCTPEVDDRLATPSMRAYTDTPGWNTARRGAELGPLPGRGGLAGRRPLLRGPRPRRGPVRTAARVHHGLPVRPAPRRGHRLRPAPRPGRRTDRTAPPSGHVPRLHQGNAARGHPQDARRAGRGAAPWPGWGSA
ncbi:alpha/beta hydrolase fold domain-containing protein [Streptomyces sp. L7]